MVVHYANKGNIGAIGKSGVPFELRSQRSPVEIKIVNEDGALRIADVQNYSFSARDNGRLLLLYLRPPHVHLKGKHFSVPLQESQVF